MEHLHQGRLLHEDLHLSLLKEDTNGSRLLYRLCHWSHTLPLKGFLRVLAPYLHVDDLVYGERELHLIRQHEIAIVVIRKLLVLTLFHLLTTVLFQSELLLTLSTTTL